MSERYSGLEIEPLLELDEIKILHRLEKTLSDSISMRAAIAFYAIHSSPQLKFNLSEDDSQVPNLELLFYEHLPRLIAKDKGGFLCCDFMSPTNFDYLAEIARNGEEIFIHWRKVKGGQSTPLLHSKLLLFELENGKVEIWTGSHNWTKNALTGPQLNFSTIIHAKVDDPIYKEVGSLLKYYRELCKPFNPSDIGWYKKLQKAGTGKLLKLIELEDGDSNNPQSIRTDSQILLFDKRGGDLESIKNNVGKKDVFLSLFNPKSDKVTFYETYVLHAGDNVKQLKEYFGKYRFVGFTPGQRHIKLEAESEPKIQPGMKDTDKYIFVILQIKKAYSSDKIEVLSPSVLWCDEVEEPPLSKRFIGEYQSNLEFLVPVSDKEIDDIDDDDVVQEPERSSNKLIILVRIIKKKE